MTMTAKQIIIKLEEYVIIIVLGGMILFTLLEVCSQLFGFVGPIGTNDYLRHFTLLIGFIGAITATRLKRHLNFSFTAELLPDKYSSYLDVFVATVGAGVTGTLAWASWNLVAIEYFSPNVIAGWIPQWIAIIIIPIGFTLIALRFAWHASKKWTGKLLGLIGSLVIVVYAVVCSQNQMPQFQVPGILFLLVSAILGVPIFVIIGGITLILFSSAGISIAAIPAETYRIVASPVLPSIPLFTLTGYILAQSGASRRFFNLFKAFFSWMPAGTSIAAILGCAFITSFTGASGVTILALGGLLLPVLLKAGYEERFTTGLLTATGSIGLLFPPSLAIIFYGATAHIPINKLFLAGIAPGLLLILVMSVFTYHQSIKQKVEVGYFDYSLAKNALFESKWEVLIPVIIFVSVFGGFMTLVEAAGVIALYTLIIEIFVYKDIRSWQAIRDIFSQSTVLVGGILVILSVAMGFTSYLVDAQVPVHAARWVETFVSNKLLFLLLLNVFLLIVGCIMDIFSAILVVVPLLIPIASAFNIHPVHLGMIFLVNLELGYLTPPVGLNLFLASYRFDKSLIEIYKNTLPFFFLLLLAVLIITYIPAISLFMIQ